ncbi:MAG: hypothetical protein IPF44_03140 [Betaproteobacteria bacterium]|nr:hypothetical protein [Betaproteobacteria bacterium]
MAGSLASSADNLIDFPPPYIEKGLPDDPPGWLVGLPFFGSEIDAAWHRLAGNREELNALVKRLIAPARTVALVLGIAANGLLNRCRFSYVTFFLYRDGAAISNALPSRRPASWAANSRGEPAGQGARHGGQRHARHCRHGGGPQGTVAMIPAS